MAAGITSITLTDWNYISFGSAVNLIGPGSSVLTVTTSAAAGTYDAFYWGSNTGNITISGLTLTTNRIFVNNDGDVTIDDVVVEDSDAA